MAEEKVIEKEVVEIEEVEQIDGMESNIEDGFSDDPLADVFTNESKMLDEEPKVEVKEEKEPEKKVEEVLEKKEEPKVETLEELTEKITGLTQALSAERGKKREAQERVYELTRQPAQEPKKEEFDWTNPEKTIEGLKNDFRQESDVRFLNMSEAQCKVRHEDYADNYKVFAGMVQTNPSMIQTMLQQPDPAEWGYQQAKNHAAMQEFGNDPAAYRTKLTAEITAEVMANIEAGKNNEIEKTIQKVTNLPPSANSIKGKGDQKPGPVILDDPLGSIFGDR